MFMRTVQVYLFMNSCAYASVCVCLHICCVCMRAVSSATLCAISLQHAHLLVDAAGSWVPSSCFPIQPSASSSQHAEDCVQIAVCIVFRTYSMHCLQFQFVLSFKQCKFSGYASLGQCIKLVRRWVMRPPAVPGPGEPAGRGLAPAQSPGRSCRRDDVPARRCRGGRHIQ